MKRQLFASFMLAASLSPVCCLGQISKEDCRLAVDVLKGKDISRDKEWALNLLQESQMYEKDASIQNVLGVAFLHGIGTEADTVKAISHFKESGEMGYSLAYHNLGMYYKYAANGRQDLKKACEAFESGSKTGNPTNCYNYGFMLYKGLGCTQDYSAAIEQFHKAAALNDPSAIFMLGLCYRNGYGVEADAAIASAYLNQAADLGFVDAMEELLKEEPENSRTSFVAEIDESLHLPTEMESVVTYLPETVQEVSGYYNGAMAIYDWSGEHLIEERQLNLELEVCNDSVKGLWIQESDSVPFVARIDGKGSIHFMNTEAELYDRYAEDDKSKYKFESININYASGIITGDLRLYSITEMEPERPMYVCLKKQMDVVSEESHYGQNRLYAYSCPSSDQIILRFNLVEDVQSVSISFYSREGNNVKNYSYGALCAGDCEMTVSPDLPDGYYTIRIVAGTEQFQTIIVR